MNNINLLIKKYKSISLRKKILIFIFSIIIISSLTSLSSTYFSNKILSHYNAMFQRIVLINELSEEVEDSSFLLQQYLLTHDSENYKSLEQMDKKIKNKLTTLSKQLINENSYTLYLNVINMYDSYQEVSIIAINEKVQNTEYIKEYQEAAEINSYIIGALNKLKATELDNIEKQYNELEQKATVFQRTVAFILAFLLFSSIIFSFGFSKSITKPIQRLMEQTSRITKGKLEMKDIEIDSYDEIGQLTMSFNEMIRSIQRLIKEISDKAQLENSLKEAELKALQSQVNPHFLFNVLSTLTESALIEGADKTLLTVEKIASLMRYTLTSFRKNVTLKEELSIVKKYTDLQYERFSDRISFVYDLPDKIPDLFIPPMTIQPIIENALIHGLEKKIEGGTVKISLRKAETEVQLIIEDNGLGMPEETLSALFLEEKTEKKYTGHTTGIGIRNVYDRLKLFFGSDWSLIRIKSQLNKGTVVTINFPLER